MELYAVGTQMKIIEMEDELKNPQLEKGDVYFVETPSNPSCILYDIEQFATLAHEKQAYLVVDSTFATPVLQNPLQLGADVVMHSCTKYLGGHSDLLGGVLITKNMGMCQVLLSQRTNLGSNLGNLETWLLLRSLRTLKIRVQKQSRSAIKIARFLSEHPKVTKVWHPSITSHPSYELCKKQMRAPPSCFSFELGTRAEAETFPSKLNIIVGATSLGGVESLIDYRHKYDSTVSQTLLRISIGLESAKDLINDLKQALDSL